jgi:hypothetical protein
MDTTYELPVSKLLWIGEPGQTWRKYSVLGLGQEHIPELMRMVKDPTFDLIETESAEVWGPVHAWRALAELRAAELPSALLDRLDEFDVDEFDDQFLCDFSKLMVMYGPTALTPLIHYLNDRRKSGTNRWTAAEAIAAVADAHPEVRRQAIAALEQTLSGAVNNPPELNAGVIAALVDLGARDSMDLIRKAMTPGTVDESICGSLESVEFDLGFRDQPPPRRRPRIPYEVIDNWDDDESEEDDWSFGPPESDWSPGGWGTDADMGGPTSGSERRAKANAKERARARRKKAKAARKKNRKK